MASLFLQAVRDPEITLDEVDKVIERFSRFEQIPDRYGTNPVTKESVVMSGVGKALYMKEGTPCGNFSLEDGRLLFTGVPREVVEEVAAFIEASLEPWDAS